VGVAVPVEVVVGVCVIDGDCVGVAAWLTVCDPLIDWLGEAVADGVCD
jgi:hypothetical protein